MQGDPVNPGMAGRERGMGNVNVATSCANLHVLERVVLEYQLQTRLKTLPTFRPDALAFFRARFSTVFEAGIRELPFLMPEPAEKPSLPSCATN